MDNIDDQFSLKWNNFQSNLATGFHDLLQEEMMVDVTLAAEGKFLQAHKIILSVCSPYFKDLFKINPCKHPIVILKDVGHQEMADMLDFMYRGEANVRQEDLAAFLKLAETLKVKGLAGDKQGDEEAPPPSSQAPRKSAAPQQVPKKKKLIETSVFESDDHDPGDSDYNPGGGEPRRKKRRSSPPPKTETVMPSASSSTSAQPFPLANPKQEMPDPEEIQLIDDNDEANDPLVQLISGQGTKQEHDQQDFDDSNFDNTLEDTGDGSHETDFDMSAGPSGNPDESTDQVPQDSEVLKKILARVIQIQDVQMVHSRQLNYLAFGQDLFSESNNEFANKLPITTLNDLEAFDAELKSDELLKFRLIEHLSRVGGNSVVDATRRIMKKVLTDDVAQLYSYRGLKKKMRFDQLALKGVIFDSVRRNPPSKEATDVEMEKILKEHLKHAKFRLQSKKLNNPVIQVNMV